MSVETIQTSDALKRELLTRAQRLAHLNCTKLAEIRRKELSKIEHAADHEPSFEARSLRAGQKLARQAGDFLFGGLPSHEAQFPLEDSDIAVQKGATLQRKGYEDYLAMLAAAGVIDVQEDGRRITAHYTGRELFRSVIDTDSAVVIRYSDSPSRQLAEA